jgi:methylenetetrahydrofolate dehydrogenase (NADP+)/methenyltetrahydrofolate cyclohydrolase/formyltetrahydrofolate synthetase
VHEIESVPELLRTARRLNCDPAVHAIVTQMPVHLDGPLDNAQIYQLVVPWKDVDGLNPVNMGRLAMAESSPYFYPCTAAAVMELLAQHGICVAGKRVCIIGRSAIVGRPLMHMMMRQDATVTVCHSLTKDVPSIVRESEIVVVAVGKAGFLKANWIMPGAVVIDVGINETTAANGQRALVGDAEFGQILSVASAVTPVPGGVGPLTVAMLMRNVLRAYELNTTAQKIKSL